MHRNVPKPLKFSPNSPLQRPLQQPCRPHTFPVAQPPGGSQLPLEAGGRPPGHHQGLSHHVGSVGRAQEGYDLGHVLWGAQPG